MKYIFIILFFVISKLSVYSYEWTAINQDEEWNTYFALSAYDTFHYVLTGEFNHFVSLDSMVNYTYIKETTDGGNTWKFIFREDDNFVNFIEPRRASQVEMLSPTTIVAGFEKGMLLRTSNGGITWDSTFFQSGGVCTALDFYNGRFGAVNFQNIEPLSLTLDSGKTWQQMEKPFLIEYDSLGNVIDTIGSKYAISELHFFNDSTLIILFANWTNWTTWILKTYDRGKNWIYYKESNDYSSDFFFANDSIGFMGCVDNIYDRNPFIKKTTDGGLSWNKIWTGSIYGYIYDMSVIDKDTVYAIGNTYIIKTTDGGTNWNYMSLDTTPRVWWNLIDIEFGSKSKGLIINNNWVVYSNSIITTIDEYEVTEFNLEIYPSPSTKINSFNLQFNLKSNSRISIALYNSLGIKVTDISDGFQESGEHTIHYSPPMPMPSGLYWLCLTVNGVQQAAKPFVILE